MILFITDVPRGTSNSFSQIRITEYKIIQSIPMFHVEPLIMILKLQSPKHLLIPQMDKN